MPIRRLVTDAEAKLQGFVGPASQRRREVLRETLSAFRTGRPYGRLHQLAQDNLRRWKAAASNGSFDIRILVIPGDWGDVTRTLTQEYGECFAVLNMANAYFPGGAYSQGAVAQEENMFRRTDCHFQVQEGHLDELGLGYLPKISDLLNAEDGHVYLDTSAPRVCIRGPEERAAEDLGYRWLPEDSIFPFYELRAAAQDLRDGSLFNVEEARHRIAAQFDTLIDHGVRHAVLGAFGCGAFLNPAERVARLYKEELAQRSAAFAVVAFAIFAAGYGPSNFGPFSAHLSDAA